MTNLTLYNGNNSQEVVLSGLVDASNNPVSAATITATLTRSGATLPNSTMTFTPVAGTPGNYMALLNGFDAAPGNANLAVSGSNGAVTFNFTLFVTIAQRSL